MRLTIFGSGYVGLVFGIFLLAPAALAGPLAAPGDTRLRHDLQLLNDSGAINIPLTAWPMALGDVNTRREFLHVDDLADACIHLMANYSSADIINVGWGKDISIAELASLISEIVGFSGGIEFDRSKPDGTPQKLLDTSKLSVSGWRPSIALVDGIADTYDWYRSRA